MDLMWYPMDLLPRQKRILRALIEDYIQNAEPVGSKSLAERQGISLSPATLRHEMADLEEKGYLEQPHTSAGRVPSPRGYRMFVDELMEEHRLTIEEMESINTSLRLRIKELGRLVSEATRFLSSLTRYTAYTLTASTSDARLTRFDLFPAGSDAFVIVVVTDAKTVKNRLAHSAAVPTEEELRKLTRVLNRHWAGLLLRDIGEIQVSAARREAGSAGIHIPAVVDFLYELREEFDSRDVVLSGQEHILGHPEYRDIIKARRLLEYLSDRREMSRMSLPEPDAPVQILIGPENVAWQLRDTSVVMASYTLGDNNQRGMIGVVGPTRMDYAKLSSRMAYFARQLGKALSGELEDREP